MNFECHNWCIVPSCQKELFSVPTVLYQVVPNFTILISCTPNAFCVRVTHVLSKSDDF